VSTEFGLRAYRSLELRSGRGYRGGVKRRVAKLIIAFFLKCASLSFLGKMKFNIEAGAVQY
jgi:hypothetical protein